jgi:3',5'-cyclic AMP phosphodiesterase CpdA
MTDETRQLLVIHISDTHFGSRHQFEPPLTPTGDRVVDSRPTMLETLIEDLTGSDPGCPLMVCLTGDLAETGGHKEFEDAKAFIEGLSKAAILGKERGIDSIFAVPGNHDLDYSTDDMHDRWQRWMDFHYRTFKKPDYTGDPYSTARVVDRSDDLGAIIVCLNSAMYVRKDTADEQRGRFDMKQLTAIEDALEAIPNDRLVF